MARNALFCSLLMLLCCYLPTAHATIYPTRFPNVTWDDDNWRLTTTYPNQGHYQSRASLSNGYIGINLAALGPFFEVDSPVHGDNINGWPLFDRRQTFATVSGFWDVQPTTNGSNFPWLNALGGESIISGLPHWSGVIVQSGASILDASTDLSQITGFSSTLDMGAGILQWRYTWTPPNSPALDIAYSTFVHKLHVNQGFTQLQLTSSRDANVTVIDVLNGDCALRTKFVNKNFDAQSATIWSAVQPQGIDHVTAFVYSTLHSDSSTDGPPVKQVLGTPWVGNNASSIAQSIEVNLMAGKVATVEKFIGIASTDAFENPQSVAMEASRTGVQTGYVNSLRSHIAEWQSIMTADSIDRYQYPQNGSLPNDENLIEQQIASVVNPFSLLQQTVGKNAIAAAGGNLKLGINSIAVGGLGSDSYGGLIFWDAEVWMAPGLVISHPDAARQIANYRASTYPQAKLNVKEAYTSSQNKTDFSENAAIFPWTSGRFGNCTGTGPCFDYEYHINGDIGLELMNYYIVTGDAETFRSSYFPIYDSVAQTFADLAYFNKTSGKYNLLNATDPDEYANNVDNPGYTMVLMKTHLNQANQFRKQFNMSMNSNWSHIASNLDVPVDHEANIILEYTTMNGSILVKQADVVLVDDLLDYKNPYTLSDLDFYAGRQSLEGPGMTYGVFSIIAAKASPSGCSDFTYQLYSSLPYTRAPWYQYSEQLIDNYSKNGGTHPAFPFLTAMGGTNRVAIFAYLGLRLQAHGLNIDPTLPPQIPNLKYRTFFWQGHAVSAFANQTHTTVSRLSGSLPNANRAYENSSIPVTIGFNATIHKLAPGGSLVFKNRQPGLVKTVPGNVAQCLPVHSEQAWEPGQFPLSAVDGAVSTKWQPKHRSLPASITVQLGQEGLIDIVGFAFDWAQSPPKSYSITFSNHSNPTPEQVVHVVSSNKVQISTPYDPKKAALITAYMSNTTNITLQSPVRGGIYATLTIEGNQADHNKTGPGASVAEWAIISKGYSAMMRRYHTE